MKNGYLTPGSKGPAILGGFFWTAWHLFYIFSGIDSREIGASILVAVLGVFLMAFAVYSLIGNQHLGTVGKASARFLLFCMGLFILGASVSGSGIWQGGWLIVIGAEALTTLGLAAFSLGALAEPPRALWKWLPLFLSPIYFISWTTTAESFPAGAPASLPEWFAVAYGLGWVLIGFLLPRKPDAA